MALQSPSQVYRQDSRAVNWHDKQSNPSFDTAAKKLARKSGHKTVRCVCGCHQEFPSALHSPQRAFGGETSVGHE